MQPIRLVTLICGTCANRQMDGHRQLGCVMTMYIPSVSDNLMTIKPLIRGTTYLSMH